MGSSVGPIAGLDLRWRTPLPGFVLGAAYSKVDLDAPDARIGSFPLPINSSYNQRQLFAQYEHGKLTLTTEWRVNPVHTTMGQGPTNYTPMRSWYAMASYRVATKLVLGAYYDTELAFFSGGRDRNDPGNYAKDVTVNSRFDFNRYLYCKLEGHFIHGNTVGFYPQTNPDGFTKNTKLLVARVGVSF